MLNKTRVFIPIKFSEEPPATNGVYHELVGSTPAIGWFINGKREHAGATHWLKEADAYVLSADELKEVIKNAYGQGWYDHAPQWHKVKDDDSDAYAPVYEDDNEYINS